MKKKTPKDPSRPTVQVSLPEVKLNINDLAYLRSVAQPKQVRCTPANRTLDKLRFLDLIARAKVHASEEALAQYERDKASLVGRLRAAVDAEDWQKVSDCAYSLRCAKSRVAPQEDDVLTEKGRALLLEGEIKVRVRKVGCI